MTRTVSLLLAAAITLAGAGSASAFHHCRSCCRTVGIPVVPMGGMGVTPGSTFMLNTAGIMPASTFGFGGMQTFGFGGMQMAPSAGLQYSTIQPVPMPSGMTMTMTMSTDMLAVLGPMLQGLMGRLGNPAPANGLSLTQIQMLLDPYQKRTDAKLTDLYAALKLIAKQAKVDLPPSVNFPTTSPSPAAQRNVSETRRLLSAIEARQAAWTAPATAPSADAKSAEIRRLLAEVDARQAAWKGAAETAVAATGK